MVFGWQFLWGVAVALFWLGLTLDRSRRFPWRLRLGDSAPLRRAPSVTALVPARDEAEVLRATLPGLLAQTHAPFRVMLVDDESRDGTAAVATTLADEAGAGDRLQVLRSSERSPGWVGKVWALECGWREIVASADGCEWVLLTDADILHPPESVARLLAQAEKGGYDMVSVMVRLRSESFWERLVIPAFVFFFHLLYPFREVCRRGSSTAAAAGGCVLLRRRLLEAIGGPAAIRTAVIDDVALARAVQRQGGRLWLGLDPAMRSVRPYVGLGELWRMVSRTAFVQLGLRWSLVAVVVVGLFGFVCSPPILVALGAVAGVRGGGPAAWSTLALGLLAWALQFRLLLPWVRHHGTPSPWSAGLPFSGILYAGMTVGSAWDHLRGRGARWKGRSYGAETLE